MRKEIITYYGDINAGYLHAYSEAGTEFLLSELVIKKTDVILEIGFGTGSTLVKIKARNPDAHILGVELSDTMLQKASARLRFCGFKHVILKKTETGNALPFEDNFFDIVYAESVLGIQEGKQLEMMFSEIFRILKPGGRLMFNETLWLESVSTDEIKNINSTCKKMFGIIQANMEYPGTKQWEELAYAKGFSDISIKKINEPSIKVPATKAETLSKLFTFFGKLKALNPTLRREFKHYSKTMNTLYGSKRYMDGVLFSMSK